MNPHRQTANTNDPMARPVPHWERIAGYGLAIFIATGLVALAVHSLTN